MRKPCGMVGAFGHRQNRPDVTRMSVSQQTVADDLLADERWRLVERIVSSQPFQKSARLRDLLLYISERTIHGHAHDLTEQHIGKSLYHKPSDYSPLEDSSVRVHARQLRLKLHEYFDGEGSNEPLILDIPTFQNVARLRHLLLYISDRTIHVHAHDLTEQHIGKSLYHKPSDYSPLEDSSVRVHARQLRLKLHEYFDGEGSNEPLILDIPK